MRDESLVSVVIPVYNISSYIGNCLKSVISQTYTRLEIILVNDGSTDDSVDIINQFEDERIILITQENAGLSAARNTGIDKAKGEYIFLLDGDDYISKYCIEILYKSINNHSNTDIAVGGFAKVYEDDDYDDNCAAFPKQNGEEIYEAGKVSCMRLYEGSDTVRATVAWGKLYRRKLFDNIRYPIGLIHEDECTTYKLMYLADNIAWVDDSLYYYVHRRGSIMNSKYREAHMTAFYSVRDAVDFFISNNESELANMAAKTVVGRCKMLYEDHYSDNGKLRKEVLTQYRYFISNHRAIISKWGRIKQIELLLWGYSPKISSIYARVVNKIIRVQKRVK